MSFPDLKGSEKTIRSYSYNIFLDLNICDVSTRYLETDILPLVYGDFGIPQTDTLHFFSTSITPDIPLGKVYYRNKSGTYEMFFNMWGDYLTRVETVLPPQFEQILRKKPDELGDFLGSYPKGLAETTWYEYVIIENGKIMPSSFTVSFPEVIIEDHLYIF